MGINCPDVEQIIHYGPPECLEDYILETGRARRKEENELYATLIVTSGWGRYIDDNMLDYVKNRSLCCRKFLFPEENDRIE